MKRARRFIRTQQLALPAPMNGLFVRTVRLTMEHKGISGEELARRTGISPSYLSRVLSGERTPPADSVIEQIAEALGLNPDRLLVDAGRLPVFMRGPVTDDELEALKRALERSREGAAHKPS